MTTELALYGIKDLQVMSEAVAQSGLFGMKTWQQALALMLVAQAEGQHPATITQDYDIIQGKACRKTHSVLARFQQAGGRVEWHQLTEAIADATFSHASGGSLRMAWTFDQAKKAGLTNKDNWKNYPRAMLRARVIAEGVRAVYPAAIGGMLIAEEAQDLPTQTIKDMGSAEIVQAEPKAPEPWPADKFAEALAKHKPTIESGAKTAGDLVAWMATKAPLTDEQRAAVLAIKKAEPIEGSVMTEAEIAEARARELAEAQQ